MILDPCDRCPLGSADCRRQLLCGSLSHLQDIIQLQASLYDVVVGPAELSELSPSPEEVFRCAVEFEGATRADLNHFLHLLKSNVPGARKRCRGPLVSREGLALLVQAVWQTTWQVCSAG